MRLNDDGRIRNENRILGFQRLDVETWMSREAAWFGEREGYSLWVKRGEGRFWFCFVLFRADREGDGGFMED